MLTGGDLAFSVDRRTIPKDRNPDQGTPKKTRNLKPHCSFFETFEEVADTLAGIDEGPYETGSLVVILGFRV